jgi:ABC-type phosphate transport system auxiliary subunit
MDEALASAEGAVLAYLGLLVVVSRLGMLWRWPSPSEMLCR